jgi:phospholipid-binding lipoprotein MlaA
MKKRSFFLWLFFLSGCTSPSSVPSVSGKPCAQENVIYDPLETFNRKVFTFNQVFQAFFWSPLSTIYQTMLPPFMQKGVQNIITTTNSFSSGITRCLFGDFRPGQEHFVRFLLNMIIGAGGLVDVSQDFSINPEQYDFGKGLCEKGGLGPGIFLNIPFLGPTTSRDIVGTVISGAASFFFPFHWLFYTSFSAMELFHQQMAHQDALDYLNTHFHDPYITMRQTYYQLRGDLKKQDEDFYKELENSLTAPSKQNPIHKNK